MTIRHILLAIFVVFLWGLDFVVAKVVLAHFPAFFLLTLRFGIAAVLLIPFLGKPPLPLKMLALLAFTFSIVHAGMIFLSLRMGLSASVSVVAGQMRVPLALILSVIFLREVIRWRSITGISLSILGTLILVGTPNVLNNYWAFLAALGGALGWAAYNTLVKSLPKVEYFPFMAWISLLSTPMLLTVTLVAESVPWRNMPDIPFEVLLGLLYLVSFSTILSQSIWYKLLQQFELNQIAPYTLLVPFFGIISATIFLGEDMNLPILIGGLFTIAGVGVVVWRRPTIMEPVKKTDEQK